MKKAFTLLEILVVIGIISIILALGTTSYSTAQKKARDAKRKSDLKSIQNALEEYYSVCGYSYPYPAINPNRVPTIVCLNPSTAIMPSVPVDPKTGQSYTMTGIGSTYTICVPTRAETPPVLESESNVTSYCLSNQQ
ncbi:MAG: type II secretion system protein [Microgenomates group bacterium]|nr:type II secretion system protein [Microgenomates group bacterium]